MGLLRERRFGPFFWTQFLGAFTDNLFKQALMILIAFQATTSESETGRLMGIASGLFILPFFLFSPLAGQISDKLEKSWLTRRIKLAEIAIMVCASVGFVLASHGFGHATTFLMLVLFLMGAQSTFFGPIKFSIIPQHLSEDEIMHGTGLVEMGTFIAILLGTMVGGVLVMASVHWVNACLVGFAVAGWWASRRIPAAPPADPELEISFDWVAQYRKLYAIARRKESVFLSIIGISWFWFFGSLVITQIPNFVKYTIGGDEWVATLFFGLFTISISMGSLLTTKLSDTSIELGMVPLGALGLSVFALDLGFLDYGGFQATEIGVAAFLGSHTTAPSLRVMLDICAMGISGSFFIVPLYALLQHRSEDRTRSQVIAANNVAGALFMVASSAAVTALYAYGLSAPQLFLVVAAMNLAASVYVFGLLPEFVLRFGIWALARTVYRLRYENRHAIPRNGACVLVANHVSFIDWLVVTATCQRPVHFVMYHKIFDLPFLRPIFRLCKAIPIAPASEDAACKARAFERIAEYLSKGDIVCIFPEGRITHDGTLDRFRPGVEQILETTPVPVIPLGLNGLWGSFFSRVRGSAMKGWPKPRRRVIEVAVGEEMSSDASAAEMEEAVRGLLWSEAGAEDRAA